MDINKKFSYNYGGTKMNIITEINKNKY